MRTAILNRISRRKYTPEKISAEIISAISGMIEKLNNESGLTFEFIEDASEAFSSMRKTYGMFSGVRSVIVMKGPACDENLAEKIGYYGEELVLNLTDMELGTCWVAGTFDRNKFTIPENEKMLCVLPVGNIAALAGKEKFIRRAISKNRKPANERLVGYDLAPSWARDGIEAVRLAPSAVNSQKPVFKYADGIITASVPNTTPIMLVDLGIAKKHFEIEAGGTFDLGNGAKFNKN